MNLPILHVHAKVHLCITLYLTLVSSEHAISFTLRPAYGFLKRLDKQFKGVPLMALTATATPDVLIELKQLLGGNPICEISTVNKANITYNVHEIKPQGTCSWHTSHNYVRDNNIK